MFGSRYISVSVEQKFSCSFFEYVYGFFRVLTTHYFLSYQRVFLLTKRIGLTSQRQFFTDRPKPTFRLTFEKFYDSIDIFCQIALLFFEMDLYAFVRGQNRRHLFYIFILLILFAPPFFVFNNIFSINICFACKLWSKNFFTEVDYSSFALFYMDWREVFAGN